MLTFFGGKGGVGKTTAAAATAITAPGRTLLISTDPAHNVGHVLHAGVGKDIRHIADAGIDALELAPDAVAAAHCARIGELMAEMLPRTSARRIRQHVELAAQSPGAHEAALLEELARTVLWAESRYEHVIVDTAPTGHTARLLDLPAQLERWMEALLHQRGRAEELSRAAASLGARERPTDRIRAIVTARRDLFAAFARLLTERAHFVLVLTPERMPVLETIDLAGHLRGVGITVRHAIVNRCSPRDAGPFLASRADLDDAAIATLTAALPDVAVTRLPLLPGDVTGIAALRELGSAHGLSRTLH